MNSSNSSLPIDPGLLCKTSEIKDLLKKIENRKSPGLDNINNKTLKKLPPKALIFLNHIFNCCFKLCYFPNKWKEAKVIAIPKPGKNHSYISNYRPISLLSGIAKFFEKIIEKRLRLHVDTNNIIPYSQFGFQPSLSTTHQLPRLSNLVKNNRKSKKSNGMVLLDTENAFDTIWHKGLLYKLILLKFPKPLIKIIQSFMSNRKNNVHIANAISDPFLPVAGVPQGSTLSPLLFNIYISDLPDMKDCSQHLYADDFSLTSSAKNPKPIIRTLNIALAKYSKYCRKWKIKTNDTNPKLSTSVAKLPQEGLKVNNTTVSWKNHVKYLGLTLDKRLTYKEHIEQTIVKAEKLLKVLHTFLHRKSKLNIKNKMLIYYSFLRPVITYATPIWKFCASTHKKRLQVLQNKILKIITNVPPWYRTASTVG